MAKLFPEVAFGDMKLTTRRGLALSVSRLRDGFRLFSGSGSGFWGSFLEGRIAKSPSSEESSSSSSSSGCPVDCPGLRKKDTWDSSKSNSGPNDLRDCKVGFCEIVLWGDDVFVAEREANEDGDL
jgi:hypothetical protein